MITEHTTARAISARENRNAARAQVAKRLRLAAALSDTTFAAIAACLGVSGERARRMADDSTTRVNLTVADALCLPPGVREEIADMLAASLGCRLAPMETREDIERELELIAETQKETSEAVGVSLRAAADGHITVAEAEEIEREASGAANVIDRLRILARAVLARRGKTVTR